MLTCEIMAKRRGVDLEEFEDVSGVTQPSPNAKLCGVVRDVSPMKKSKTCAHFSVVRGVSPMKKSKTCAYPFAADAQLFFFHSRAVVFHNFVFCISGRVLWSGVVVSPPSLPS